MLTEYARLWANVGNTEPQISALMSKLLSSWVSPAKPLQTLELCKRTEQSLCLPLPS